MMKIEIEIPDISNETGLISTWDVGAKVQVKVVENDTLIWANKDGLISLARHLLTLAYSEIEFGHYHYDDVYDFEAGSSGLVIDRIRD
jgi:hypothetical protein